jgi:hypothetical protein
MKVKAAQSGAPGYTVMGFKIEGKFVLPDTGRP